MSERKMFSPSDEDFEEVLQTWFKEIDEDLSDEDDNNLDPDFAIMSDHDSSDEVEEDVGDCVSHSNVSYSDLTQNYYYGKNRMKWSNSGPNKNVRTRGDNIITHLPGLRGSAKSLGDSARPIQVWDLFFTDEILDEIVIWTNNKIEIAKARYKRQNKSEFTPLDKTELKAVIGLLLFSSIYKSGHERLSSLFATNGRGRSIFRSTMSLQRCYFLLATLRFDDPQTRAERKELNPTAAFQFVFEKFVQNCLENFSIGEYACIDEMLVGFRGKCRFKVYIPSKPNKYGLKIMVLSDARSGYFLNGYIYCGKGSDGFTLNEAEKKFSIPTQAVIRLSRPILGTHRNITADSWFSSMEVVEELKKRGLTYVGTIRKNKRDIPPEFLPCRKRKTQTCIYGFTQNETLVSYVPKPAKAVILISSMHHREHKDEKTNLPEIVAFYNCTKGGVDSIDQKCATYSCNRRTQRWPMALFYAVVNIASVNSYLIHQSYKNAKRMERFDFVDELAYELVKPQIIRRYNNPYVQKVLKETIERVVPEVIKADTSEKKINNKRKRCYLCPYKKDKKTSKSCKNCQQPICQDCSVMVCSKCQT